MIRSLRRAYHFTHRLLLAGVFAAAATDLPTTTKPVHFRS